MASKTRQMIPTGTGAPLYARLEGPYLLNLCALYDGTRQDFEKALAIEEIVWPTLNKRK